MQLQYAAETLQVIPDDHILAQKFSNASGVKQRAASEPVELLRGVIQDLGGRATVDQIAAALAPEVFSASEFKKWWDSSKKKLKADGHFQIPVKKTDPIVLLEVAVAPSKGLIERFRGERYLKEQVAALDQITKALDDFAHEVDELRILAAQVEDAGTQGPQASSGASNRNALSRDEIINRHSALERGAGAPIVADILRAEENKLGALL